MSLHPTVPAAPVEVALEVSPSPVAVSERVAVLDALRGFALFGILLINITAFKAPGGPPGLGFEGGFADRLVLWGLIAFIESKFFTLFSFLFGVGFAVQLLRAQARSVPFAARFARRLLILGLFGALHVVFLWEGDILLLYALVGSMLLLFRSTPPRKLLRWIAGLFLVPLTFFGLLLGGSLMARALPAFAPQLRVADEEFIQVFEEARAEEVRLYGTGNYAGILAKRVTNYTATFVLLLTRVPSVLAMFLLGLYVGRTGILQGVGENIPLLRRVQFWGLSLGLLAALLVTAGYTHLPSVSAVLALFFNQASAGPLLSLGYAATFVLLARSPAWQRRFRPLSATGRMALTNYIVQSLVCSTLFYGYGFGLAGKVTPSTAMVIAVGVYTVQTLFSVWWLRHFRFGPLEWVWRSLTYGRVQPLRVSNPSLVIIVGMLVTALVMHRMLEIGKTKVYGLERVLRLPFSLYAGWLTAATILNTAGVLAVNDWNALGVAYPVWGVIMLVVATLIGLITRFRWNDPVYGAVFVWAFAGVVVARPEIPLVAVTAGVLAVAFAVSLLMPATDVPFGRRRKTAAA